MTLFQYRCNDCDVYTWVNWLAHWQYQTPCCAECGSDKNVESTKKFIEIKEEVTNGN